MFTSQIERLGRALLSQLTTMTGERARLVARVTATTDPVLLKPNTYAYPIRGTGHDSILFKAEPNPATAQPFFQGGEWTIEPAGTEVMFQAYAGGARFNLPAGTKLRLDPVPDGLEPDAVVTVAGSGGSSSLEHVQHLAFFDDLPNEIEAALAQAKISAFPAIILAWLSTTPIEGRSAGIRQGASRKQRGVRINFENFALFAVSSKAWSLEERRRVGFKVLEEATGLLTDRKVNDDGEILASLGTGVDIQGRARYQRVEGSFVFLAQVRCTSTMSVVNLNQAFAPWKTTRTRTEYPTGHAPPPDPLYGPDTLEPMPQPEDDEPEA